MFKNLKIAFRLQLGFVVVLIISLTMVELAVNFKISDVVHEAEKNELRNLYKSAMAEIESEGRLAQAMSFIIASNQEMSQAMAESRRDELAARTVPLFKDLKEQYSVRQFQFHLPPAISFLRAHKAKKFGDDLSSFRKTILATNDSKKPVKGLEKGVAGLGIRGINPVFHDSKHIGSVEFGMSFGQAFFDKFKQKYGVNIALHVNRENEFKIFGGTLVGNDKQKVTLLKLNDLSSVLSEGEITFQSEYNNVPYAVYAKNVTDFSGNPIGVMEIALDRSHYVSAISSARNMTLLIGFFALILGSFIAFMIGKTIVNPIQSAVSAMNEIAKGDGDLTKRLNEKGKDEIALLGKAFNLFAERVRQMVVQVSGSTSQLAAAAEEMSVITNETNQGVQQQQAETEMVATAMNEMTATVQEVARHATEASEAAKSADNEANDGKSVVQQTVASINSLASEIENATSVINKLETDSDAIGSILDVIRGIAEQTNLLALNAAIEAARAGEQGRGFAVVADEVRTLASRTQQSTQEIQNMIESLQSGSRSAVKVMELSQEQSKQSVDKALDAQKSLEAITDAVTTISNMNIQIANAAKEQSNVSEEINKNVVNISQVVERTAEGAQQTQTSSHELSNLANELQLLVEQFKT
ncbi:MAG: methyl-accepting chemotaxis protein [Gammaproteobacteria bacterium]|nr:methyl-accepting chemotaxis protein [Gammaproteobacteria bacterium]